MQTMFIAVISESRTRLISAHHKPEYDNLYEVENAIRTYLVKFVRECGVKCLSNKRCVSFFYNNLTGMCILHSNPFTYTVMPISEKGWKFYLSQEHIRSCNPLTYLKFALEPLDINTKSKALFEILKYKLIQGTCHYKQFYAKTENYNCNSGLSHSVPVAVWSTFFYYRELDLCYEFKPPIPRSVIDTGFVCPGTELMRIDSIERQEYIKLVTADIGKVYPDGICIQGKKTQGKWTYNDGSTMEYFRWLPNEPSEKSNVIRMVRLKNYEWRVINLRGNCTYMCEYRLQS
ncbi:unnamed protein product [Mytilus edulis]|uniref:C-type lectin domain-containing protein n=1 Tax=Mytilus edulis TaxID=6550 RepID=A0A8S3R425_MYTED|nr:unnamed protein product [Mytilus edulis]